MKARVVFCLFFVLCLKLTFASPPQSIKQLQQLLAQKKVSCEKIISQSINRIKRYDLSTTSGAPLNAIIAINPNAINQARQLDKSDKLKSKPLFCVPVVIKDNYDSIDTPSTTGSLSMLGSQPLQDAVLVKRLKQQGAIIIAKTNMDEFASGLIGISSRGGRVGNAYDSNKNPGGSSGGSAVAVAAGYALLGMGSDNSGSIRVPAVFNGLIGLRPSQDLLSLKGLFPRGNLDAVAGPIVNNSDDLIKVMSALTANDYQSKLIPVKKMRLGIVTQVNEYALTKISPKAIEKQYQQFYQRAEKKGIKLIAIKITNFDINRDNNTAGEVEKINQYLQQFPSTRQRFIDICQSKRTTSFGSVKECIAYAAKNPSPQSAKYNEVLNRLQSNRQLLTKLLNKNKLDGLIMPIGARGTATYDVNSIFTWLLPLSSNSGLPSLALPIGLDQGMPVGIEIIARYRDEATLLSLAKALAIKLPPPSIIATNRDLSAINAMQFNNLKTKLGWTTYKQFLSTHPHKALTPKQFKKITNGVI